MPKIARETPFACHSHSRSANTLCARTVLYKIRRITSMTHAHKSDDQRNTKSSSLAIARLGTTDIIQFPSAYLRLRANAINLPDRGRARIAHRYWAVGMKTRVVCGVFARSPRVSRMRNRRAARKSEAGEKGRTAHTQLEPKTECLCVCRMIYWNRIYARGFGAYSNLWAKCGYSAALNRSSGLCVCLWLVWQGEKRNYHFPVSCLRVFVSYVSVGPYEKF